MTETPHLGPEWADLAFHVLAHVIGPTRFPSSLHDPRYVSFVERHLGPASARPLGEDADALGRILTSHELVARAEWVAFLFADANAARSAAKRDLTELAETEANRDALRALSGIQPVAEALRAAAELEAPHHARLPSVELDTESLRASLLRVRSAAPRLATLRVACLRSLSRHGRVVPPWIYVGAPSDALAVTAEGAAMQAGHEATVVEVGEAALARTVPLGERDVEHAALVVLAERAARVALQDEHGRWWTALGLPALADVRALLGRGALDVARALSDR